MNTEHILTLLITERDKLNRAIEALRGQDLPPVKLSQSEKMKLAWAKRKAAAK